MLDQVKDSRRWIILQGLNVIRGAIQIQLTENQTWYGDVVDLQGYSLFGYWVTNHSTSPAGLSQSGIQFAANQNFSSPPLPFIHSSTPSNPGGYAYSLQPLLAVARFARPYIKAGSTTGAYTVSMYWIFSP